MTWPRSPLFASDMLVEAIATAADTQDFDRVVRLTALTFATYGVENKKHVWFWREKDGTYSVANDTKAILTTVNCILSHSLAAERVPKASAGQLSYTRKDEALVSYRPIGPAFTSALDADPLVRAFPDGLLRFSLPPRPFLSRPQPVRCSFKFYPGGQDLPADVVVSSAPPGADPLRFADVCSFSRGEACGGELNLSHPWVETDPDEVAAEVEEWDVGRLWAENPALRWLVDSYGQERARILCDTNALVTITAGSQLKAMLILWSLGPDSGKSAFLRLIMAAQGPKARAMNQSVALSDSNQAVANAHWALRLRQSLICVKDLQSCGGLAERLGAGLGDEANVDTGRSVRECDTETPSNALIIMATNFPDGPASMVARQSKNETVNKKTHLLQFDELATPKLDAAQLTALIRDLSGPFCWAGMVAAMLVPVSDIKARIKSLPTLHNTVKEYKREPWVRSMLQFVKETCEFVPGLQEFHVPIQDILHDMPDPTYRDKTQTLRDKMHSEARRWLVDEFGEGACHNRRIPKDAGRWANRPALWFCGRLRQAAEPEAMELEAVTAGAGAASTAAEIAYYNHLASTFGIVA